MKKLVLLCLLAAAGTAAANNTPLPDFSPVATGQHVVINIPQMRLFLYENGQLKNVYPVAVGKNRTRTPLGNYNIGSKAYNPTWTIPASIRRERAASGLPEISSIPPGPSNPLGPVFVRLGPPRLGLCIHGTNAPSSVPGIRSRLCRPLPAAQPEHRRPAPKHRRLGAGQRPHRQPLPHQQRFAQP